MATDQLSPSPEKLAEALRESVKTAERLRKENQQLLSQANQPIAIVGMGCRFPGGVHSPQELWELLKGDVDAITKFPSNRGWGEIEDLFHPDPEHPRTTYSVEGGFVEDADEFDAAFFSIGPREAMAMDPQQRLLLEVAWEAIESAGIDPGALRGSVTGVYAGISATGYGLSVNPPEDLEGHLLMGTTTSVASGRLAYAFGFGGPTMSVDTACSSSLVVLHLACQALQRGECSMALAGGSTVYATPALFIAFSRQRGLAPDGRCKAFAAGADGVGWGEGAALVALERLEDAERTGHPVLALIRGTAVNQDGASNGLSAPNGHSQERVIQEALRNAGMSPSDIDMVEAHGTGTPIGDPIEAMALLSTYGQGRENGPLRLGSIKSNIGHAVAAAGMGGLIKAVMALREGWLPRTLHVEEPTPHVDWTTGDIKLLTEPEPWPEREQPRRAGVSSFGISGTNAHAILEEVPPGLAEEKQPAKENPEEPSLLPFLISAKSEEALKGQAQRLRGYLEENPQVSQLDLAFSLATRRAQMDRRAVVVGSSREDLLGALELLGAGAPAGSVIAGAPGAGKTAFQFTGQGAQRPGMGAELYRRFPVFASALDAVCAELDPQLGRSLKELMFAAGDAPEAALLDRTEFAQPALFALEVALFRLVESFGLVPDMLIGHSIGEVSAAHVAGVLSLADAATLVVARGRLMGALPPGGTMLAVEATEEEVSQVLADDGDGISIAGLNGPMATVVSGETGKVELFEEVWKTRGRKVARLRVSHAFHSHLMEPMLEEFEGIVQALDFRSPQIPVVSNLSGEIAGEELAQPDYWVRHVRSPVRYADGVAALERAGVRRFVEIGPDAVLSALARFSLSPEVQGEVLAAPTMRARGAEEEEFTRFLGTLHANGLALHWPAFFEGSGAQPVILPTYAFQRQRYWIEYREGIGDVNLLGQRPTEHRLISAAVRQADDRGWLFTGRLTMEEHPWLADHAVMGFVLLPGTAYIELALVAGRGVGAEVVEELNFETPLLVPEEGAVQLQVVVEEPDEEAKRRVAIYSRPESQGDAEEAPWTRHASGVLCPAARATERREGAGSQEAVPPEGAESVETDHLYDRLAEAGYDYGPAFQGLHAAWVHNDALFGEVALDDQQAREAEGYLAHPALVDASLHVALQAALAAEQGKLIVPFSVRGVRLHRAGAASLRIRLTQPEENTLALEARDHTDSEVLSIDGLVARPIDMTALQNARGVVHDSLYKVGWQRIALPQPKGEYRCVLLGDGSFPGVEQSYADVEALAAAIETGAPAPDCVLVDVEGMAGSQGLATSTHTKVRRALELLKAWLAEQRVAALRLVFVTRGAVQAKEGEVPEASSAAVLGLLRSAQSEQPGRLVMLDLEPGTESFEVDWQTLFASGEPQLAIREGVAYVPRLSSIESAELLALPAHPAWQLSSDGQGTLAGLSLVSNPQAAEPLQEGQVRIAMRATGLNFRDVLLALNSYPGEAPFGWEGAGIVTEVGPGVDDFAVGDRVLGAVSPAFGSTTIAHHKVLVPLPEKWSFAEGASIPIAFLTAFYALRDLAKLKSGERVLIHAGAGGVGMAAVQIARHLGAEVFATASLGKWEVLKQLGLAEDHLASSRDLGFREKFLTTTEGKGVDVVLNALAGEFLDASLDILPGGGRFIEMGKADIRDAQAISSSHPGVQYRPFDISEAGPDRLGELLRETVDLIAAEKLRLEPITTWDIRRAIPAFRFLRDGRNVGKVVLRIPQPLDPKGTVLITGGTGSLGAVVARHLVEKKEVGHLLLVSRRGAEAEGVAELQAELTAAGCEVQVAACDVADRAQLKKVIASIPKDQPLTGVIHAAGVLADGTLETLGEEELERVLRPKVDAVVHLHELTEGLDLPLFSLFSSGAATIGNPGQANYAAANAFLDAFAQRRQAAGLSGQALGWGLWEQEKGSGMGGELDEVALKRLRRVGIIPLSNEKGLELFDAARQIDEAAIVPVHLDLTALRRFAKAGVLPPLLRRLVRTSGVGGRSRERSLARRLAAIPKAEWGDIVLQTLRSEVATVLGYDSAEMIDPQVEFKDLGFDSLAAVELYNRLCQTTSLRLPTTMGFDYPTPEALAGFLQEQMEGGGGEDGKAKAESNEKAKAGEARQAKAKGGTAKKSKSKSKAKTGTAKKPKAKAGTAEKAKSKANGKAKMTAARKAKAKAQANAALAEKAKAVGKPKGATAKKAKKAKAATPPKG